MDTSAARTQVPRGRDGRTLARTRPYQFAVGVGHNSRADFDDDALALKQLLAVRVGLDHQRSCSERMRGLKEGTKAMRPRGPARHHRPQARVRFQRAPRACLASPPSTPRPSERRQSTRPTHKKKGLRKQTAVGTLYERCGAVGPGCPASGFVSCPAGRSLLVRGSALPRCVRACSLRAAPSRRVERISAGAEENGGRGGVGAARRARKQDGRVDAQPAQGAQRRRQERHRSPRCTADVHNTSPFYPLRPALR